MTSTLTKKPSLIQYSSVTIKRGKRALLCSSFKLNLFTAMIKNSIPLLDTTLEIGKKKGYTKKVISENQSEKELMWLIKVGILRREVDGQGITDSFRLTPLGREIINNIQDKGETDQKASLWDYIIDKFQRWFSWIF